MAWLSRKTGPAPLKSGFAECEEETMSEHCVLCSICLGEIDKGRPYMLCPCGRKFHPSCSVGLKACPSCGAPIFDDHKNESAVEEVFSCPVCGSTVHPDAVECTCGALFE